MTTQSHMYTEILQSMYVLYILGGNALGFKFCLRASFYRLYFKGIEGVECIRKHLQTKVVVCIYGALKKHTHTHAIRIYRLLSKKTKQDGSISSLWIPHARLFHFFFFFIHIFFSITKQLVNKIQTLNGEKKLPKSTLQHIVCTRYHFLFVQNTNTHICTHKNKKFYYIFTHSQNKQK